MLKSIRKQVIQYMEIGTIYRKGLFFEAQIAQIYIICSQKWNGTGCRETIIFCD